MGLSASAHLERGPLPPNLSEDRYMTIPQFCCLIRQEIATALGSTTWRCLRKCVRQPRSVWRCNPPTGAGSGQERRSLTYGGHHTCSHLDTATPHQLRATEWPDRNRRVNLYKSLQALNKEPHRTAGQGLDRHCLPPSTTASGGDWPQLAHTIRHVAAYGYLPIS
mgnify:CR=1 FL=1